MQLTFNLRMFDEMTDLFQNAHLVHIFIFLNIWDILF